MAYSGGCQCGAVRFRIEEGGLGDSSICHCRMCQKATGNFFGAFVSADNRHLTWTRGEPTRFQSSDKVRRGFCKDCGTPLTYELSPAMTAITVGSLDQAREIEPNYQLLTQYRLAAFDTLHALPVQELEVADTVVSYQHPDWDTEAWPPATLVSAVAKQTC